MLITNNKSVITSVCPDPFLRSVYIKFSPAISGNLTIKVYNLSGDILYTESQQNPPLIINIKLQDLPSGTYILLLTANNYAFSKTLIKQESEESSFCTFLEQEVLSKQKLSLFL